MLCVCVCVLCVLRVCVLCVCVCNRALLDRVGAALDRGTPARELDLTLDEVPLSLTLSPPTHPHPPTLTSREREKHRPDQGAPTIDQCVVKLW